MTGNSRRLAELGLYAALSVYFTWPLLVTGGALGIEDWDPLLFQHGAVLKSLVEYGAPPFWNPWYCGGNVLWQNPQAPLLTPAHPLALVVDLAVAMKINVALHYLAGFTGMYVLLRRAFGIDSFAWRFVLGGTFTFAGGAAMHLAIGHASFLPYFYLPWVLWLFLRALDSGSLAAATGAGALLALAIWNGGVYVVVMCGVAFALLCGVAAVCSRSWRPLGVLGFTGAMAGLLAAPKFLPVLLFVADPRKIDIRTFPPGPDVMSPSMLLVSLMDPFQHRGLALGGHKYGWAEYGNYLGPLGAPLIAAAVLLILCGRPLDRERSIRAALGVTTAVLLLIAAGDFAALAPYSILQSVPGFAGLRVPSRYLLVFTLFGTAAVASLLGTGGHRAGRAVPPAGVVALALVLGTVFLAHRNRQVFDGAFPYAPPAARFVFLARPPAPAIDAATDGWAPDSPMVRGLFGNRGVLRCNEPFHLPGSVDPAAGILLASGGADVAGVRFSPNRIEFDVTATGSDGRITMNQRFARGWRSSAGPLAIDGATGLAYVRLPAGSAGRHAFAFTPPGLYAGIGLFALGLLTAGWSWRRRL